MQRLIDKVAVIAGGGSGIGAAAAERGRSPRLGEPTDIAATVAFLASGDGEWINGQVISVDGGVNMR
ncbi:2-hydroxycyclohexanecarboxyl-CoA dehydrogenase [compost metagenome]